MTDSTRGPKPSFGSVLPAIQIGTARTWLFCVFLSLVPLCSMIDVSFGQDAEEVHRQLDSLVQDGRYAEALVVGRQSLDLVSQSPDLAVAIADLALKTDDLDLAVRAVRSVSGARLSDFRLPVVAAELEVKLGRLRAAQELLESVCRKDPSNDQAQYRLARVLFARGRDGEAIARASRAVELGPSHPEYRQFYASLLEGVGRTGEALRQLEAAWRLTPHDGRLLLHLADQERLAGRLNRAVEYLELAVQADSENPLFRRELARVDQALGRFDEAQKNRDRADSLEAAFAALSHSLNLSSSGRPQEAIETLEPVVARNEEFMSGSLALAGLLQKTGRAGEALRIYENLLGRLPDCRQAREETAWLLFLRGKQEDAIKTLHAGKGEPSASEDLFRARANEDAGDLVKALDDLRRVERRYPLDPSLKQEVSRILNEIGQPREALASLERAYALSPGNPKIEQGARRIRFGYAFGLEQKGEWAEAQQVLESLVRERRDSLYLFHLAYCLQNQQKFKAAVDFYREGLNEEPDSEWAGVNLAFCLFSDGAFEEAASVWQHLIRIVRKPQYVYSLGLTWLYQSKVSEGSSLIAEAAAQGYEPALEWMHAAKRP